MMREPNHNPVTDSNGRPDFRNSADPCPRPVTRTTSQLDGFPTKMEPRKDLYRARDWKDGWTSHPL